MLTIVSPFTFRGLRVFRCSPYLNSKSKNSKLVTLLLDWFAANARDLPWRHTRDPYAIWVSEIMLQQTQVKTVIPYWERWMKELPTIPSLAKAKPDKIHKLWEGLGYYTRVRNMQKAAQQIVSNHRRATCHDAQSDGDLRSSSLRFPDAYDEVLALPGIGRYTAGAICSIAFNQPTPILDGNVIRVLTRLFGIKNDPREKKTNVRLWNLAEELVGRALRCPPRRGTETAPYPACSHLNQSLMELGALICTPRSPNCTACPVRKLCVARTENLQEQLPNLGKRAVTTERRFLAFIVERNGKYLVRQRPGGVVNAHLWEFPNIEATGKNGSSLSRESRKLGFVVSAKRPLKTLKHSITRYRITLEAYRAKRAVAKGVRACDGVRHGEWRTLAQLQQLAFTSAHKKILANLGAPRTGRPA